MINMKYLKIRKNVNHAKMDFLKLKTKLVFIARQEKMEDLDAPNVSMKLMKTEMKLKI